MKLDIKAYLKRINYHGSLTPNPQTLRDLHLAHLMEVPFENLSIHTGEDIVLDDTTLFKKIVERRRGGFCYELNGLFAALLRSLGFNVTMLSGGVAKEEGGFGPEFDHMILMVTLEERWLVDVGFGDSFRQQLLLDQREDQLQDENAYRIAQDDDYLFLMGREEENGWEAKYRFTLQPYQYADYQEMCRFHRTSPESGFTKKRICSKALAQGRITLSDMRLIVTGKRGEPQERELKNGDEYASVLGQHFGIIL